MLRWLQLREGVLPVPLRDLALLNVAELQEVRRPVVLMIEVTGCAQLHAVLHQRVVLDSHEVVIPWSVVRNLVGDTKVK